MLRIRFNPPDSRGFHRTDDTSLGSLCSGKLGRLFEYSPDRPFDLVISRRRAGNDYKVDGLQPSSFSRITLYSGGEPSTLLILRELVGYVYDKLGPGPLYVRLEQ